MFWENGQDEDDIKKQKAQLGGYVTVKMWGWAKKNLLAWVRGRGSNSDLDKVCNAAGRCVSDIWEVKVFMATDVFSAWKGGETDSHRLIRRRKGELPLSWTLILEADIHRCGFLGTWGSGRGPVALAGAFPAPISVSVGTTSSEQILLHSS